MRKLVRLTGTKVDTKNPSSVRKTKSINSGSVTPESTETPIKNEN